MEGPRGTFGQTVSEEARRMADRVNLALVAGDGGKWLAIRLSDGGSDGVTYDVRSDAVRHQLHETQCLYVKVPRQNPMPVEAAQSFLTTARKAYDAGFRFSDPDADSTPRRIIL